MLPVKELLARSGWKSPTIVHSTVMRIVRATEPGAMQAAWAGKRSLLQPSLGILIPIEANHLGTLP